MNIDIAIAVTFVVGLLLYGISTSILRGARETPAIEQARTRVRWPRLVDESLTDTYPQLRMDIVERLSIVDEPWCAEILRQAMNEEDDAGVRSAIAGALSSMRTV